MDNLEAPASSKPRLSLPFLRDIRARRHRRSYNVTKKSTSVDHDNEGMASSPADVTSPPTTTSPSPLSAPANSSSSNSKVLPFLRELLRGRAAAVGGGGGDGSGGAQSPLPEGEELSMRYPGGGGPQGGRVQHEVIFSGELKKLSLKRDDDDSYNNKRGHHKQQSAAAAANAASSHAHGWQASRRKLFQLTEERLDYFQPFSQVKVRRSYPLTSIEKVEYEPSLAPLVFKLYFSSYILCLEAECEDRAREWVQHIRQEWQKWFDDAPPRPRGSSVPEEEEEKEENEEEKDEYEQQQTLQWVADEDRGRGIGMVIPETCGEDRLSEIYEEDEVKINLNVQEGEENEIIGKVESPRSVSPVKLPARLPGKPLPMAREPEIVRTGGGGGGGGGSGRGEGGGGGGRGGRGEEYYGASLEPFDRHRSMSDSMAITTHMRHSESMDDYSNYRKRRKRVRIGRHLNLVPRLEKRQQNVERDTASELLHHEYSLIKYPHSQFSVPNERLFRVDKDNLLIMWRRTEGSHFTLSSSLRLDQILEIREGQWTKMFERFPYEEVEEQSFSLMFEESRKGGKYVGLSSLDLICDHPKHYKRWFDGLTSLIPGPQNGLMSTSSRALDPTIVWLKWLWNTKVTDHEMPEREALAFIRKLNPTATRATLSALLHEAHIHQFKVTFSHGDALHWDGFVLLYNLMFGETGRLYRIFREYALQYPSLGLTPKELKAFLIQECYWHPTECTKGKIDELIRSHNYHHRAYRKYAAKNKPLDFKIASGFLCFAGLLSFLRSSNNSIIDPVCAQLHQDMSQPLSHYFINSSHNTYLDTDQLKGSSSCDAYVRSLMQGCRCVEIDCWDESIPFYGEPVIYHGYTITTKLPFSEVIQTITDYSFRTSIYPIIISIENHCSPENQKKMAKEFKNSMGDILCRENEVERNGLERLPSPEDLQGKIILKGSYQLPNKTPVKKAKIKSTVLQKAKRQLSGEGKRQGSESGSDGKPSDANGETSPTCTPGNGEPGQRKIEENGEPNHKTEGKNGSGGLLVPTSVENQDLFRTASFAPTRPYNRDSVKKLKRNVKRMTSQLQLEEDDQELEFNAPSDDLRDLIIYCRSVSIKPWSWEEQSCTPISCMFSFGEPTANKHCKESSEEMLACTERQLVRTYPKGTRFDSSNYDPMVMWSCGIQMVSLNYQTPDVWMHINQGFFRQNGGCGYVLKPRVMRRPPDEGSVPFSPYMTEPHPDINPVQLEIELISGQRLCPMKKKTSSITVDIQTFGIPEDRLQMDPVASHNYPFWPQWSEAQHIFKKTILMPELCMVYFRVEVVLSSLGPGKPQLYAQNCIPLNSMRRGLKFLPLRTPGGQLIHESGLFIYIRKMEQRSRKTLLIHQEKVITDDKDSSVNMEGSLNPPVFKRSPHIRYRNRPGGATTTVDSITAATNSNSFDTDLSRVNRHFSSPPLMLKRHNALEEEEEEEEEGSSSRSRVGKGSRLQKEREVEEREGEGEGEGGEERDGGDHTGAREVVVEVYD